MLIFLIGFAFLGLKSDKKVIQTSTLNIITFVNGKIEFTKDGCILVDSVGLMIKRRNDFFEEYYLVIQPYTSKVEFYENKFIGFERFLGLKEYFKTKYKIDENSFILFMDAGIIEEPFRGQTGLAIGLRSRCR